MKVRENGGIPMSGTRMRDERFQTLTALKSHLRSKHPDSVPKVETREVPIVEEDFTTAELARDKRMTIMRKASYGVWDK